METCPICGSEDFELVGEQYDCEGCDNSFSQIDIDMRKQNVAYGTSIVSIGDFMNNGIA